MALTSLISSLRLTTFLTSGNPRVSMAVMNIHVAPPTVSRLSMVVTNVHVAPPTTAHLSQVVLNTWVSLDQGIRIPNEIFGGNQVFTPSFTTELQLDNPEPPVVEVNPYQANTPNVDHQRIMREQHNLLQAGDSTFHWGVLTDIYAEPKYTLGSLGRFYHDQLGMIHARFVKFVDLVKCDSKGFPVGWHTSKRELWTVTNQLSKSSQLYAVGVAIPYNELAFQGDCYGWVIVDGLVPVEMDIALDSTPIMFGTEYGWSDTGKVKPSVTGYSLGIRFTTEKLPTLPIGTFKVELEKLSQVRLAGIITTKLVPLSTALGALTTRVSALETTVGGHTTQISGLTSRVDALELSLASEIKSLSDSLAQIRRQIPDSDFVGYVNTAISNLKGYVDANNTVIGTVANNALLRANAAYALAESTSYAAVQAQIDAINTAMGGITDRLIGFTANIDTNTLTAGQVLVSYLYATDAFGVKFFDFRPLDFLLTSLLDVDMTTTPPAHGDSITWDAVNSKWVPTNVSGGGGGIAEAPIDGTPYARQDGGWVPASAGGSSWPPFQPPDSADFVYAGYDANPPTVTDDPDIGMTVTWSPPVSGDRRRFFGVPLTDKTQSWELIIGVDQEGPTNNYSWTGMGFYDSIANRTEEYAYARHLSTSHGNNLNRQVASFSGIGTDIGTGYGPLPAVLCRTWYRGVYDSGTGNLSAYISLDGKRWTLILTRTATTWLTNRPSHVGLHAAYNRTAGRACVDRVFYWSLTGPGV